MTLLSKKRCISGFILFCAVSCAVSAQADDRSSWTLEEYVVRAVEVSDQIEGAERSVESAREHLEEVRLAGATEFDLDAARLQVEVAGLSLEEARRSVVSQSLAKYLGYVRSLRSYDFAKRSLDIRRRVEEVSKERFEEGVKTEDAYLGDVSSRLNAELSLLQREQSLESSRRSLLRFIDEPIEATAGFAEVDLPYVSIAVDEETLLGAIRDSDSSYRDAVTSADLAARRLDALSRLQSSVTEKELEAARLAAERADDALASAKAVTADRAWQLVSTLAVREKGVETGEQLLAVAEKTWERRQEQHDFGLISDLDLIQAELSYDQSRDQAVRNVEDHLLHYVEIEKARGADLLSVLRDRLE